MTGWVPGSGGDSPDRVDALVHAATELTTGGGVITASTPPATPLPGTSSPAGWGMMPGLGMPGGVQATPALDDLRRGRRR